MGEQKIDILISAKVWDPQEWVDRLSQFEQVGQVHVWPTEADLSQVKALFVWRPLDAGLMDRLPQLEWVSSLGAGVDHLIDDPQIPAQLPLTRVVDPFLSRDMTNYVVMGVMMHQRKMSQHLANQQKQHWHRSSYQPLKIGILGLGVLGAHCAAQLVQLGFDVSGLSQSPKSIKGVASFLSHQRADFLADRDVLVNLLPVTAQTESILDQSFFAQMKKGAYLINVARGSHLVEEDLIPAIDSGQLSGALLDVFRQEPLPQGHPFWKHPQILITPHVASVSIADSVMNLIQENIKRLLAGQPLLHQVNRDLGY